MRGWFSKALTMHLMKPNLVKFDIKVLKIPLQIKVQ